MRWALITHPEHWRGGRLIQSPTFTDEHLLRVALEQGWIVLARESDIYAEPLPAPKMDMNLLSNPRRESRRDHGYGHVED